MSSCQKNLIWGNAYCVLAVYTSCIIPLIYTGTRYKDKMDEV